MAMTVVSDVSWDQDAWEKLAYFALRPELHFEPIATVKGENLSADGSPAVKFTITRDISPNTAALNESTDITPGNVADDNVTVNLREHGDAVKTSALVRGTSFLPVNPVVANVVGFHAGISIDTLVSAVLAGGTNVRYSGQAVGRSTVIPTDTHKAADVRYVVAKLRGANVQTWAGGFYGGFIHPDVAVDLTTETGSAAWRDPHTYSEPGAIWNGEIGAFQGVRYVETPRAPKVADAGSSTTLTDVYQTIYVGQQCLAKAYSKMDGNGPDTRLVPSPVTDVLRRFTGVGWYWLGGYGRFREPALYRVESASSIGANAA